jgi:hypothetical protein
MSNAPLSAPAAWKANTVRGAALLSSLAIVSLLVLTGSRAAFTDSTANAGNEWTTGTVELTDDQDGTAMFAATGILPGYSDSRTIDVTYDGPAGSSADVTFTADVSGDTALTSELLVTVTRDEAAVVTDVALGALADHSFVLGTDTPTSYDFTVRLPADTGNEAQDKTANATFTWSASVTE